MSKNTRDFFTVEILAIILSFVPLLFMWLIPKMTNEAANDDMALFVYGMVVFMTYPALNLLISFLCSWFGINWYISILSAPCALIFAATTYYPVDLLSGVIYCLIYAVLGAAVAFPVSRYKRRKDEDAKYLGKRL